MAAPPRGGAARRRGTPSSRRGRRGRPRVEFADRFPDHWPLARRPRRGEAGGPTRLANSVPRGRDDDTDRVGLPYLPGFEIPAKLGEGGMGQVYKARQPPWAASSPSRCSVPERLARRPACRASTARCWPPPGSPTPTSSPSTTPASTGHALLRHGVRRGAGPGPAGPAGRGPLPVAEACDYVRQAALGLQHAHEQGLVHRDVKPANLIVTPRRGRRRRPQDPRPRPGPLAEPDPTDAWSVLTVEHTFLGTPDYISPEQAESPQPPTSAPTSTASAAPSTTC